MQIVQQDRDVWKRLAQELRAQEAQVSGALCDAGTVDTCDLGKGVRELTEERDRLRGALVRIHRGEQPMHLIAADALWGEPVDNQRSQSAGVDTAPCTCNHSLCPECIARNLKALAEKCQRCMVPWGTYGCTHKAKTADASDDAGHTGGGK